MISQANSVLLMASMTATFAVPGGGGGLPRHPSNGCLEVKWSQQWFSHPPPPYFYCVWEQLDPITLLHHEDIC